MMLRSPAVGQFYGIWVWMECCCCCCCCCCLKPTPATWVSVSVFKRMFSEFLTSKFVFSFQPFWKLDRHLLMCFLSIFVNIKFVVFQPLLERHDVVVSFGESNYPRENKKYGACWMNMLHVLKLELLSLVVPLHKTTDDACAHGRSSWERHDLPLKHDFCQAQWERLPKVRPMSPPQWVRSERKSKENWWSLSLRNP